MRQEAEHKPQQRRHRAKDAAGVPIRWHLLQVMTDRGIRFSVDLKDRLDAVGVKLSAQHVNRLVSKTPDRLSIKILYGLCSALDCEPGDLLKISHGHRGSGVSE